MAIRIRTVDGIRVALCAVETDPAPGDVYLDDGDHYALAAKFSRDWRGHPEVDYPEEWAAMDTQKRRDAREVHERLRERERSAEHRERPARVNGRGETDPRTTEPPAARLLRLVAQKLSEASHGRDYGELDAEGAFNAAMWAVTIAIEEAIRDHANNPEAG